MGGGGRMRGSGSGVREGVGEWNPKTKSGNIIQKPPKNNANYNSLKSLQECNSQLKNMFEKRGSHAHPNPESTLIDHHELARQAKDAFFEVGRGARGFGTYAEDDGMPPVQDGRESHRQQ